MLFWKKDEVDLERQHKAAQKGYGIEHPEKIQGFGGYFGFAFGDIYIDEYSFELLQTDKDFEAIVNACLTQFRNLDYGRKARKEERDLNFENRLFFGLNCGLVGRYETRYGILEIQIPEEGITEIELWAIPDSERRKNNPKRLFKASATLLRINDEQCYRLENEHEEVMGETWDGDLEKLLKNKYSHEKHPEDYSFHKTFPYSSPLERNGIAGDDEMFVEWDDGDHDALVFYYTKPIE